jgi:hypothetical protein
MSTEHKNKMEQRVELKYLVPRQASLAFLQFLQKQNMLQRDPWAPMDSGKYTIESLYYDTPINECLFDSIEGYPLRKKVRIRHYRDANYAIVSKDTLELKIKRNQLSHKVRSAVEGDIQDIIYDIRVPSYTYCGPFLKKMVIEYERYPFVYVGDDEVRVTLDIDVRAKAHHDFSTSFRGNVFLNEHYAVLEIKSSNSKLVRKFHHYFKEHIPTHATRFSKYCLGVLSMNPDQHIDYWSTYKDFLNQSAYESVME